MAVFNELTTGTEVVTAFASQADGKTFLITGPSKGSLGAETAISLASACPKQIILAGRSVDKISPVVEEITKINPKIQVTIVAVDLCDNASIRKAAAEINANVATIDVIMCCAGTMAVRKFTPSADGVESQFGANYLGHFLLTNLIIAKLAKTATFVTVTSMGYELAEVNFEKPNFEGGKTYNPWVAYGQATTAKILLAVAIAKKLKIPAYAVHPGFVPESQLMANNGVDMNLMMDGYKLMVERSDGATPLLASCIGHSLISTGKDIPPQTARTLQQGCATILLAALDPSLHGRSPSLMMECRVVDAKDYATSLTNADRLWELSERLVGQTF